jgi:hypothetical protein
LFVEVLIFAAFAVSVGMMCATATRTSKQSMTIALLVLSLGTTIVPWLGGKMLAITTGNDHSRNAAYGYYRYDTPWPERLAKALSPPRALAESVVPSEYHHTRWFVSPERFEPLAPYLALSLTLYFLMSVLLGLTARRVFRKKIRTQSMAASRIPQSSPACVPELAASPTGPA